MKKAIEQIKKIVLLFFDLVFPKQCLRCQQEGTWLCQNCWQSLPQKPYQECPRCHKPNYWGEYCAECYTILDGILIASTYENKLLKKIIKTFKYRFIKDLATPLANLLIIFLGKILMDSNSLAKNSSLPAVFNNFEQIIIVPIPSHKRRIAWRGFDHIDLLAKLVADYFNLSYCPYLKKIKNIKPQVKLTKRQRRKNVQGVFVWAGEKINNKNIILIDDITTTGATLSEAAKILKKVGANEVWGLVIAKN